MHSPTRSRDWWFRTKPGLPSGRTRSSGWGWRRIPESQTEKKNPAPLTMLSNQNSWFFTWIMSRNSLVSLLVELLVRLLRFFPTTKKTLTWSHWCTRFSSDFVWLYFFKKKYFLWVRLEIPHPRVSAWQSLGLVFWVRPRLFCIKKRGYLNTFFLNCCFH